MTIVTTKYGQMRIIESDQVVSRSLSVYGEWAQNELTLLHQFIGPGGHVLDVGAFVGTHTLAFSKFVGPGGKVYSFEPRPEIFAILAENIGTNDCSNVVPANVALGSSEEMLRVSCVDLHETTNFGGLSLDECLTRGNSRSVQISTIDRLRIEKIDLIKLDVEGMERQVLDGAIQSIAQLQPVIFCECNSISSGAELLEFARKVQYTVYAFLVSAFNPENFNRIGENIFGDSKELMLLLLPPHRNLSEIGEFFAGRLLPIKSLEDLVLPLLYKPQYAYEVLAHTGPGKSLGTSFPSPAINSYVEIIAAREQEVLALKRELARIKGTVSWKVTRPLRFLGNARRFIRKA